MRKIFLIVLCILTFLSCNLEKEKSEFTGSDTTEGKKITILENEVVLLDGKEVFLENTAVLLDEDKTIYPAVRGAVNCGCGWYNIVKKEWVCESILPFWPYIICYENQYYAGKEYKCIPCEDIDGYDDDCWDCNL